ncbi:MAG TPA: hypothetical protein VFP98_04495 [Candidatus Polarisedimenticolia bacterium]|nr:hypothetical protein [Candidatus Polarisedimenticolia bacterium]
MPDAPGVTPDPLDRLPHRGDARLPDRIVIVEAGLRVGSTRTVRGDEPWITGRGTMPPLMLVELMAQTGGLLIDEGAAGRGDYAVLAGLRRMHMHDSARAGETVTVECTLVRKLGDLYLVRCRGRADGRELAHGSLQLRLVRGGR